MPLIPFTLDLLRFALLSEEKNTASHICCLSLLCSSTRYVPDKYLGMEIIRGEMGKSSSQYVGFLKMPFLVFKIGADDQAQCFKN